MIESPLDAVGRGWRYLPPVAWAAFLWLYVINFSQVTGDTFYALVRGVGAKEYSDAIIVGSRALDLGMLLGVSVAVALVHMVLTRKPSSDAVALGAFVAFLWGLAWSAVMPGVLAFLVLGLGCLLIVAVDGNVLATRRGIPAGETIGLLAMFALLVLALVAVAGDVRWFLGGFDGSTPFSDPSWNFSFVGLQIIALLDPVLPEITILALFSWVLILLLPHVFKSGRAYLERFSSNSASALLPGQSSREISLMMLGAAIALSAFLGAYPYLHAVNPLSLIVGVDPRYNYYCLLAQAKVPLECSNPSNFFYFTHYGLFVLLRELVSIGGSDLAALELALPILAILLTISTFVFVYEGTNNSLLAGVSSLFTSSSMQVVDGINGGFLANWLALSLALLFFGALLHALRTHKFRYLVLSYFLSGAILFTHIWTFTWTLVLLGAYLFLSIAGATLRKTLRAKWTDVVMITSIMIVGAVFDLIGIYLHFGNGLTESLNMVLPGGSPTNIVYFVQDIRDILVMSLLGGYGNTVWYLLSIIGVLSLVGMKSDFAKLLVTWLIVSSIALVVFATASSDILPARYLFVLPLQVYGALGFLALVGTMTRYLINGASGTKATKALFMIALLAVIGLTLGFALDNIGFLYRGIPGT